MRAITYSLTDGEINSVQYYSDISVFTDNIISESQIRLFKIIESYISFLRKNKIEEIRSYEEYFFDMLNAGTIWSVYNMEALSLTYPEYLVLCTLYNLRRRYINLKPFIDRIRGVLITISLTKRSKNKNVLRNFNVKQFTKLLRWMEASGEFREDVNRLKLLTLFFINISKNEFHNYSNKIIEFSEWFRTSAAKSLRKYTISVNDYLRSSLNEHRWKEDIVFCARKEVEYHLSMIGAELMNRAFRGSFEQTENKALLLPACMKFLPDDKCKAKKISLDSICAGCSPNCMINRYTMDGIEKGYEVHIIPHSSDFTTWLKKFAVGKDIGIIGVACPLNLITGGLELKSLNVPAQCLLLDYCGCKSHWNKNGIPTNINHFELDKILQMNNNVKIADAI